MIKKLLSKHPILMLEMPDPTQVVYTLSTGLLLIFFIIGLGFCTTAQELISSFNPQSPPPSSDLHQQPLSEILDQIARKYQLSFGFSPKYIKGKFVDPKILKLNLRLDQLLTRVLHPLELHFEKVDERNYVIYPARISKLESKSVFKAGLPLLPDPVKICQSKLSGNSGPG
ncbi:MAG: hypothetical protein HC880_12335, partial [Bacteroidia bacterium]|nr:hypothetical protein [Bacteroidia bacterium]